MPRADRQGAAQPARTCSKAASKQKFCESLRSCVPRWMQTDIGKPQKADSHTLCSNAEVAPVSRRATRWSHRQDVTELRERFHPRVPVQEAWPGEISFPRGCSGPLRAKLPFPRLDRAFLDPARTYRPVSSHSSAGVHPVAAGELRHWTGSWLSLLQFVGMRPGSRQHDMVAAAGKQYTLAPMLNFKNRPRAVSAWTMSALWLALMNMSSLAFRTLPT